MTENLCKNCMLTIKETICTNCVYYRRLYRSQPVCVHKDFRTFVSKSYVTGKITYLEPPCSQQNQVGKCPKYKKINWISKIARVF